jgi:ferredoxin-like protein FixX
MSSSINPNPGTSSLGHVRGSSASACAMLCDHSGPTPAMHTMLAQLRPHAPVKSRESALIPIVTTRLPEAGPAYAWQLSRTPRISPQTNTCLSCALCPHSCAHGKGLSGRSPIAPRQARLTLEFLVMGFRKRSCNLLV